MAHLQNLSVLVIHNRYQQPAGEDAVVKAEIELLEAAGHRVVQYVPDNAELRSFGVVRKVLTFAGTTWDLRAYEELRRLIRRHRPHVAHCHNLVPQVSPAAYYACRAEGVPVVQMLHNYRLLCPAGTCFRHGAPCRRCAGKVSPSVRHGCYRGSRLQTAALALMLKLHRLSGTWQRAVDAYLTPSRFCRDYFAAAGLPPSKVRVAPNFLLHDPGERNRPGSYALFAGRLIPEKGVMEMLLAWQRLTHIPLLIAGDGPLHDTAQRFLAGSGSTHIKLLGHLDPKQTLTCMKDARFLVFPSRWHEPFGMGLIEAAACSVPAIASRIGGIPELVLDRQTGLLFDPANFDELAERADWAWLHQAEMDALGAAARRHYEQNFTAEKHYQSLMEVYCSLVKP